MESIPLSRISTRRKNVEAEKFPAISLADGIVAVEKFEPRIVGMRSTFRGSTFFRLVEIRP